MVQGMTVQSLEVIQIRVKSYKDAMNFTFNLALGCETCVQLKKKPNVKNLGILSLYKFSLDQIT
jgi:hypothetical protein